MGYKDIKKKREAGLKYYYNHHEECLIKGRKWYIDNKEKVRKRATLRDRKLFAKVLSVYGNKCKACGNPNDLCIDHINGWNGKGKYLMGHRLWSWIIKNNFPKDFRTLCRLCNIVDGALRGNKFLGLDGMDALISLKENANGRKEKR